MENLINYFAEKVAEVLNAKLEESNPVLNKKEQYFTVDEVCRMLHVSKATYYRHKNLGYIKPAKYVGRKPLFTQEAVNNYLAHFGDEFI